MFHRVPISVRSLLRGDKPKSERKFLLVAKIIYVLRPRSKPVASRQYLNKHSRSVGAIKSRIFSPFYRNKPDTQRTIRFLFLPGPKKTRRRFLKSTLKTRDNFYFVCFLWFCLSSVLIRLHSVIDLFSLVAKCFSLPHLVGFKNIFFRFLKVMCLKFAVAARSQRIESESVTSLALKTRASSVWFMRWQSIGNIARTLIRTQRIKMSPKRRKIKWLSHLL